MSWRVPTWSDLPHEFGSRASSLPPGVRLVRQVHGRTVVDARAGISEEVEADGLLSGASDAPVGVRTADCVPVLLRADDESRLVAAVHAGWRGAVAGILVAAIDRLRAEGAVSVEAAFGPSIGDCCYEVGDEVLRAYVEQWGDLGYGAFNTRGKRPRLDLRQFLATLALEAGAARVHRVGPCTSCTPDQLASYRRDGEEAGRQVSWIGGRAISR